MAHLEAAQKEAWRNSLRANTSPWIAFALNAETTDHAERLNGMAGLIDWQIHGQVSNLLAQRRIGREEFCLIPGNSGRHFLLYQHGEKPNATAFAQRVQHLRIPEICLAESTFPGDFLAKLKQTLKKEGIRCTKLEPDLE